MSNDEDDIPLQDRHPFSAGIKRKRVHFITSSISSTSTSLSLTSRGSTSVAARYLNLVLPKPSNATPEVTHSKTNESQNNECSSNDPLLSATCSICALPIVPRSALPSTPHEATLAHQVCLAHSHPPSHIDRSRLGLRLLRSSGWDPDSRKGLGSYGQGIQFPIKTKLKEDKFGLGLELSGKNSLVRKIKAQKLDAGKIRKKTEKDKRNGERLRDKFYMSEDVERYLSGL